MGGRSGKKRGVRKKEWQGGTERERWVKRKDGAEGETEDERKGGKRKGKKTFCRCFIAHTVCAGQAIFAQIVDICFIV